VFPKQETEVEERSSRRSSTLDEVAGLAGGASFGGNLGLLTRVSGALPSFGMLSSELPSCHSISGFSESYGGDPCSVGFSPGQWGYWDLQLNCGMSYITLILVRVGTRPVGLSLDMD
jgi:hypothetical protein